MRKLDIKDIDEKLKLKFPNEQLKTLEYQDMKKPFSVQCLSCQTIYHYQRAENVFRKKCCCSKCNDTIEWQHTKQKFLDWLSVHPEFTLVDDLNTIHSSQQHIKCKCTKCGRIQENKKVYDYFDNKQCYCQTKGIRKPDDILLEELGNDVQLLELYKNTDTPILIHNNRCGHTYKIAMSHLLGSNKNACPICNSSIGEKEIIYNLNNMHISYIREYKMQINGQDIRVDFYLPNQNCIIEYNGIQHYQPVEHFGGQEAFVKQQQRDNLLTQYCIENNISLLVISYKEFNKIKDKLSEVAA